MNEFAISAYGWSAYLSASATIFTLVTGILFFTGKVFWGKINDISSVLQVLFMTPLVILFLRVASGGAHAALSIAAAALGAAGMITSIIGQGLLIFGRIDFPTSQRFFPAGGAIGIWLILVNALAMSSGIFPEGLIWIGMLAGMGYLLTVIGFLRGGQKNALFYVGGFILGIGYPVWAIWLGEIVFSGALGTVIG
jgi:hypothetical protein